MKKTYIQPSMFAVKLQMSQVLATSIDGGDTNLSNGGNGDNYEGPIRVKENNAWDDEW